MRAVASLFAVALVMAVLHRATASGSLEARATLALGFLLLAAHFGGDLARRARLPRITGYLLVGFAVGPAWLGLVRRDEVEALRFFGDAAITLLTLAAGAELPAAMSGPGRAALLRLATGAVALPFVVVTLVVASVTPWFPLTVHRSFGDGVAVALVVGTLAATSSSGTTMTLVGELEAPGPFARGLLGVAVMQDLVVLLLFALGLALAKAGTRAGTLNLAVAVMAVEGLAGSLVLGAGLGFALGRYLRLLARHTAILLMATAFVSVEAARLARLDPVLIALAAGLALRSSAPNEERQLRRELRRSWVLVQVVGFGLAGAALRLGVLADLWPWAVLLVGLRVMSLRYGLRWAGRDARVPAALARDGWLGLLSQGGVALTLAQLARRAFPQWGVSLETLMVAMIGVHQIAGPIGLHRALVRAAEIPEGTPDAANAASEEARVVPARDGLP
jgi:Kef-type K+ transport system membrane component KefB